MTDVPRWRRVREADVPAEGRVRSVVVDGRSIAMSRSGGGYGMRRRPAESRTTGDRVSRRRRSSMHCPGTCPMTPSSPSMSATMPTRWVATWNRPVNRC